MTYITEVDLTAAEVRQTVHGEWFIHVDDKQGQQWGYFRSALAARRYLSYWRRAQRDMLAHRAQEGPR